MLCQHRRTCRLPIVHLAQVEHRHCCTLRHIRRGSAAPAHSSPKCAAHTAACRPAVASLASVAGRRAPLSSSAPLCMACHSSNTSRASSCSVRSAAPDRPAARQRQRLPHRPASSGERMRQLVEQPQQFLRHAPQVGLFEPFLIAQLLVQQGAALAVARDRRVRAQRFAPIRSGSPFAAATRRDVAQPASAPAPAAAQRDSWEAGQ